MLTDEHNDGDGRRVWLDESEVNELLSLTTKEKHRIAMALVEVYALTRSSGSLPITWLLRTPA
jgi:hypothetical protein